MTWLAPRDPISRGAGRFSRMPLFAPTLPSARRHIARVLLAVGVLALTLEAMGGRTLTLITCFPFSYLGTAPDRFIVVAREIEGPRVSPAGRS